MEIALEQPEMNHETLKCLLEIKNFISILNQFGKTPTIYDRCN